MLPPVSDRRDSFAGDGTGPAMEAETEPNTAYFARRRAKPICVQNTFTADYMFPSRSMDTLFKVVYRAASSMVPRSASRSARVPLPSARGADRA